MSRRHPDPGAQSGRNGHKETPKTIEALERFHKAILGLARSAGIEDAEDVDVLIREGRLVVKLGDEEFQVKAIKYAERNGRYRVQLIETARREDVLVPIDQIGEKLSVLPGTSSGDVQSTMVDVPDPHGILIGNDPSMNREVPAVIASRPEVTDDKDGESVDTGEPVPGSKKGEGQRRRASFTYAGSDVESGSPQVAVGATGVRDKGFQSKMPANFVLLDGAPRFEKQDVPDGVTLNLLGEVVFDPDDLKRYRKMVSNPSKWNEDFDAGELSDADLFRLKIVADHIQAHRDREDQQLAVDAKSVRNAQPEEKEDKSSMVEDDVLDLVRRQERGRSTRRDRGVPIAPDERKLSQMGDVLGNMDMPEAARIATPEELADFVRELEELRRTAEQARADLEAFRKGLEEADREVSRLETQKRSFLERMKQMFPRVVRDISQFNNAESAEIGRIHYREVGTEELSREIEIARQQQTTAKENVQKAQSSVNDAEEKMRTAEERQKSDQERSNNEWKAQWDALRGDEKARREWEKQAPSPEMVDRAIEDEVLGGVSRIIREDAGIPEPKKRELEKPKESLIIPGTSLEVDDVESKSEVPKQDSEDNHVVSLREYLGKMDSAEKRRIREAQKRIIQYMESNASKRDPSIRWKRFLELGRKMNIRGSAVLERRGLDFGERLGRERDSIVLVILMQAHRERKFDELLSEMEKRMNTITQRT